MEAWRSFSTGLSRLSNKNYSRNDSGPSDALNKAFKAARGTLVGWLNADDLYPPGALARAVYAMKAHPEWLMLYGEGDNCSATGLQQRYPSLPPSVGIEVLYPTVSSASRLCFSPQHGTHVRAV